MILVLQCAVHRTDASRERFEIKRGDRTKLFGHLDRSDQLGWGTTCLARVTTSGSLWRSGVDSQSTERLIKDITCRLGDQRDIHEILFCNVCLRLIAVVE